VTKVLFPTAPTRARRTRVRPDPPRPLTEPRALCARSADRGRSVPVTRNRARRAYRGRTLREQAPLHVSLTRVRPDPPRLRAEPRALCARSAYRGRTVPVTRHRARLTRVRPDTPRLRAEPRTLCARSADRGRSVPVTRHRARRAYRGRTVSVARHRARRAYRGRTVSVARHHARHVHQVPTPPLLEVLLVRCATNAPKGHGSTWRNIICRGFRTLVRSIRAFVRTVYLISPESITNLSSLI